MLYTASTLPVARPRYAAPLPDAERQIAPLDIVSDIIPQGFKDYLHELERQRPELRFHPWPYQLKLLELLFTCWKHGKDGVIKQTRQSGKTIPTSYWLGYMIVMEGCQVVIVSTKAQKTRKLARLILKIMTASEYPMSTAGVNEARFEDESGFVCLSGKEDAAREGDTAHIIVVDEAQDVPMYPTYADLSPMRVGTAGIFIAMGIGGIIGGPAPSMSSNLSQDPSFEKLIVTADDVLTDRPAYKAAMDKIARHMTPTEVQQHFYMKDIPSAGNSLMPKLYLYDELYPGATFDPAKERGAELIVGFDWGQRADSTAIIAAAVVREQEDDGKIWTRKAVLYRFAWFGAIGYVEQLDEIVKILRDIPFDILRPELNGPGIPMEAFLKARLIKEGIIPKDNDRVWQPVTAGKDNNLHAQNDITVCSFAGGMSYINDGGGFADRAVSDLKGVGVTYTAGGVPKTTHSDWFAALRPCFYQERIAQVD